MSRYQYPPSIKVIRVMCSGRMDLEFVLRAFANGKDGVFIGGCWLGECHYITEGNYDALSMMHLGKKLLEYVGVNPDRLRLEWVSASEGIRFAEVVTDFTGRLKELGPLGTGEGMDQNALKLKLEAIRKLLPYIKLVEREKLRVRFESKKEYEEFFASDRAEFAVQEIDRGQARNQPDHGAAAGAGALHRRNRRQPGHEPVRRSEAPQQFGQAKTGPIRRETEALCARLTHINWPGEFMPGEGTQ